MAGFGAPYIFLLAALVRYLDILTNDQNEAFPIQTFQTFQTHNQSQLSFMQIENGRGFYHDESLVRLQSEVFTSVHGDRVMCSLTKSSRLLHQLKPDCMRE